MIINKWFPIDNEWQTFFIIFISIIFLIIVSYYILDKKLVSPDSNRRLIHVIIGLMISMSPHIFVHNTYPSLLALFFVILNTLAFKTKAFSGIHSQNRKSYGTIYFPLSYLMITFFFWNYSQFVTLSLLILSLSDPIAAQIGSNRDSLLKFKIWQDYKTIEGTVAFFISTLIILSIGSYFFMNHHFTFIIIFVLLTSVFSTISEITSKMGTDNFSIPIISILIMIGLNNEISLQSENAQIVQTAFLIIIMSLILFFPYQIKSLSLSGYFGSITMGTLIILYGELYHFVILALFFILSSLLNIILKKYSLHKSQHSQRDILQVFCNGGVALVICIYDFFSPSPFAIYLFSASVAAAMADTWGTEFGKLSKKLPISVLTFKPLNYGLSGGITRIGTIGSLLGSSIIGFITWSLTSSGESLIFGIIIVGFLSSILDSILGDKFQAKYQDPEGEIIEEPTSDTILISGYNVISNNFVNFIITLASPALMYFIILFLQ